MKNNKYKYEQLILELAKQVKFNEKDEDTDEYQSVSCYDKKIEFVELSEEEIIKRLGHKKKYNLTLLKPFVDILKYKTQTSKVSVLNLSCTSKFWKNIYKNSKNVSNLLKIAQNVGLLKCVDETYQFNAYYKKDNHSKQYAWNKNIETKLLKLFKSFNIIINKSIYSINYNNLISIVETFADDAKKKEYEELSRRFNIRIAQRTCLPLNDDIIVKGIIDKYPQYLEMLKTIEEDNKSKPIDEMDYANINIKRDKNKNAIKISIRKTNQYCPAKVHSLEEDDYRSGRMIRDEIIKSKFGNVYENDVKSSIYRITKLLNTGIWEDDNVDLYETIYGSRFETKEDRDIFKHPFCMQMYFNPSDNAMKARIEYKKSATKAFNKEFDGLTLIMKARDNMFKAIGESYQSEIFLHESCIYTQVAHRLRLSGYKVIQIYDGFFTDRYLTKDEFNKVVKEESIKYYHKYIKSINNKSINNKSINNNHISNINSGNIRFDNKNNNLDLDIESEEDEKKRILDREIQIIKKYDLLKLKKHSDLGNINYKDF